MQEEIPLFVPRSHLVLAILVILDFSESSRRLLSSWKEEKLNAPLSFAAMDGFPVTPD